jgi:murein DD-endopeptidase MepM/ murein hydrolase activator NlpD
MPTTARQLAHLCVLSLILVAGATVPLGLVPVERSVASSAAPAGAGVVEAAAASDLEDGTPPTRGPRTGVAAMTKYTVQDGDTLSSIAVQVGLNISTLQRTNALPSPHDLSIGQTLVVPPENGTLATAREGDTVRSLAARYGAGAEPVGAFNGLEPDDSLIPGVALFVPTGQEDTTPIQPPSPTVRRGATGHFMWPASGTLTQRFWRWHPGIDVANNWGTPLFASDAGRITWAGWGGYGIYVEIDHGNGFSTLYGHMARTHVSVGEYVDRGQQIGLMGSTGWSSGPHVHFEIRSRGVPQDPLRYLP